MYVEVYVFICSGFCSLMENNCMANNYFVELSIQYSFYFNLCERCIGLSWFYYNEWFVLENLYKSKQL